MTWWSWLSHLLTNREWTLGFCLSVLAGWLWPAACPAQHWKTKYLMKHLGPKISTQGGKEETYPHWSKELMSHMMPWVKILCSYMAAMCSGYYSPNEPTLTRVPMYVPMSIPRLKGVILSTTKELVGRLPSKTYQKEKMQTSACLTVPKPLQEIFNCSTHDTYKPLCMKLDYLAKLTAITNAQMFPCLD